MKVTIGIDASNLRQGGGITHLVELLQAAQPSELGIVRVVVWGGTKILEALDSRPWLDKRNPPTLEKGLLQRTFWQRFRLSQAARDEGCAVCTGRQLCRQLSPRGDYEPKSATV